MLSPACRCAPAQAQSGGTPSSSSGELQHMPASSQPATPPCNSTSCHGCPLPAQRPLFAHRWQKPRIALALYNMSAEISMRRRRYRSAAQREGLAEQWVIVPAVQRRASADEACRDGRRHAWRSSSSSRRPRQATAAQSSARRAACILLVQHSAVRRTPEVLQQLRLGGGDGGGGRVDAVRLVRVDLRSKQSGCGPVERRHGAGHGSLSMRNAAAAGQQHASTALEQIMACMISSVASRPGLDRGLRFSRRRRPRQAPWRAGPGGPTNAPLPSAHRPPHRWWCHNRAAARQRRQSVPGRPGRCAGRRSPAQAWVQGMRSGRNERERSDCKALRRGAATGVGRPGARVDETGDAPIACRRRRGA